MRATTLVFSALASVCVHEFHHSAQHLEESLMQFSLDLFILSESRQMIEIVADLVEPDLV